MWFLIVQGLALVVFGVWAIARDIVPIGGGLGLIAFGLAWIAMAVFAIQFQRKSARLRDALGAVDSEAAQQTKTRKRLLWLQWSLFAAAIAWILLTARMASLNELWSIYGAGALLLAMFGVLLYRMFITVNLEAEAGRALSGSLGAPKKRVFGRHGSGALSVLIAIVMFVAVALDEFADLPVKFMSLFWYGLVLVLVLGVGSALWHWLSKGLRSGRQ